MSLEILIGHQVLNGLVMGAIYACMALGLTLIYGVLDQVNFAHGEMYMIGAYVAMLLATRLGLPYSIALLFAMGAGALVGLAFEHGVFRPLRGTPELNSIVASLGVSILLINLGLVVFGPMPQALPTDMAKDTVYLAGMTITVQRLLIIAMSLVTIAILYYLIKRTRLGKAMRAMAQDRETAGLMGIEIDGIAQLTFAIGGALAALGGGLIAPVFLIQPDMGLLVSQKAFVVVILGGMGNVIGAVAAAFFLGVVESLGAGFISSEYRDLIAFAMLILVLWLRPEGFLGKTAKRGG